MLKRNFALPGLVIPLLTMSACATTGTSPRASDITPTRDNSSWCQGDREISYSEAADEQTESEANAFDTAETIAEVKAHNVRLRAACPDPTQ